MIQYSEEYERISQSNEVNLGKDTSSRKTQICLYSDPTHFIFEILQNADDYAATALSFSLYPERLEIEHNGQPFTWDDVHSITYIGQSSSASDPIKEGHFGLGFKSVFAFTATPRVYSEDMCFEIFELYRVRGLERPNDLPPKYTRFVLPFNHLNERPDFMEIHIDPDNAFEKIAEKLQRLDMMTLLFTRNLMEVKWIIRGNSSIKQGHYLRQDETNACSDGYLSRIATLTDGSQLRSLLCLGRAVIWKNKKHKPVEVAFSMEPNKAKLLEAKQNLFVLFPTEVDTRLKFILNGPYQTNPARETISRETPYNKHLINETAALIPEMLRIVKERKLLTPGFLELLPLPDDDIPDFLEPLSEAITQAMTSLPFVPTVGGGHALAGELLQGPAAIRNVISEQLLLKVLSGEQKRWAAGVMENRRAYKFFQILKIPHWGWQELRTSVNASVGSFRRDNEGWLQKQNDEWIRKFYLLLEELGRQVPLARSDMPRWRVIRTVRNEHVIGKNAHVGKRKKSLAGLSVSFVKPSLCNHKDPDQREKLMSFFRSCKVNELDEREELHVVLDEFYSARNPDSLSREVHLRHMEWFVRWWEKHKDASLFLGGRKEQEWRPPKEPYFLFTSTPHEDTEEAIILDMPNSFYLDRPFKQTNLTSWYNWSVSSNVTDWYPPELPSRKPLWSAYNQIKGLSYFAEALGVAAELPIIKTTTDLNPAREDLRTDFSRTRARRRDSGIDEDHIIEGIERLYSTEDVEASRLVWTSMCRARREILTARYSPNSTFYPREAPSKLVADLRSTAWIPDNKGVFRTPRAMTQQLLRSDFPYENGNGWLTAMSFGEIEQNRTQQSKPRREVLETLGISSDIARLADKLNALPEERRTAIIRRVLHEVATQAPEFPEKASSDPERRRKMIAEQLAEAPDKQYEKKERTVRIGRDRSTDEAYLRELYTNGDDQLFCQICQDKMPFRRRDGKHYFERVEAFELFKEHEANNLALCPVCAAKYKEFIKRDPGTAWDELQGALLNSESSEVPLVLGDEDGSVRFVEAHMLALRTLLEESSVKEVR